MSSVLSVESARGYAGRETRFLQAERRRRSLRLLWVAGSLAGTAVALHLLALLAAYADPVWAASSWY
jgi:hypothetical protein